MSVTDLRLHKAFRAALIKARSGLSSHAAVNEIANAYELTSDECSDVTRRVMNSAISLTEEARANALRLTPDDLLGEACGFVAAMARSDADELIAFDPFIEMPRSLADPLAAVGIVTILKMDEREAVIELTQLGEVVAMVLRAQRIWPNLSEEHRVSLGNPCLGDGSSGADLAVHGLYRLNASRLYRGRSHDGYYYLRTELGRLTWVLGKKS